MNKEELILRQQELEILAEQQEIKLRDTNTEFKLISKQIENISKPIITSEIADQIYDCITRSFEDFDVNEYNPEYSFCIDYNNQISVEGVELCVDLFADQVHDAILGVFNIADEELS